MHTHISTCLRGPVSRNRSWWRDAATATRSSSWRVSNMDYRGRQPRPPREPEIRVELVARVRREIAEGTYDTPEKWEIALDRLLDRVEEE
jgi:anti-sigma28 factor (negative regulator of flagellin synthesis)